MLYLRILLVENLASPILTRTNLLVCILTICIKPIILMEPGRSLLSKGRIERYKSPDSALFYFISIWYSLNIDPNNIYRNLQRTFKNKEDTFQPFKIK